ncbi:Trp family transcriptional regulator [Bradyrhizobium oligotrophicum]|uniref:Trp family transcriptional regulator n=1 Tax=Bradyrhizobium oligotrophicum TaxID=44255 RepID=UPI003EB7755C
MDALVATLACLTTDTDRRQFLTALLSPAEIRKVSHRWMAISLLLDGRSQREVRNMAKVSIATVSRAARQVDTHGALFRNIRLRVTNQQGM